MTDSSTPGTVNSLAATANKTGSTDNVSKTDTQQPEPGDADTDKTLTPKSGSKGDLSESAASEGESDPLLGAEGGGDDAPEEQAPPLPEKPPLPGSMENLSRNQQGSTHSVNSSGSSSSSDSDKSTENADVPQEGVTHTTTVEGTVSVPIPVTGADGIAIDLQASSPNEPPPPYPGGPQPGADPYGPPAPQSGERVVTVQVTGNCPKCQVGNVMESFSFCGICLAIWLFPCGLICLFCMRNKRCSHCGAAF